MHGSQQIKYHGQLRIIMVELVPQKCQMEPFGLYK